jgi:very-short-patch-repair endonuclease
MNSIEQIQDNYGKLWFRGKDVALMLGYSNTCTAKAVKMHVHENDCCKRSELPADKEVTHNQRKSKYINVHGVTALICKSRLPNANDLAKEFGIELHLNKYSKKEPETIGAIMKAFQGERMKREYKVGTYRTDLYFPDYDLCVECDENGHEDRDPVQEKKRVRAITKKLSCKWLRFNPDAEDFNIFQVINQIFLIIRTIG